MTAAQQLPVNEPDGIVTSGALVLAAGGVVVDRRDGGQRVLVVHRPAYDDWSLPKGHIDAGETPSAAALREVTEETGVAARIVRELGTTQYRSGTLHKQVHWFLMERTPDSAEPTERTADAEVDVAAWWDADMAQRELTHPADRRLVRSAVEPPSQAS